MNDTNQPASENPAEEKKEITLMSHEKGAASPFHVKISVYDGPLDLLLELIRKSEMDIYDIPIAEITQQYLDSINQMKQLDLEIAGEFIVMAATLIYIKSKMLLPQGNTDDDDEGGDPRAELVRKLLEYQAFKEAAKELGFLEDERGQTFTRQIADYYLTDLDPQDLEIDTFSANLYDLLSAFQKVLSKLGNEPVHEVFEQIISIEEKMMEIKTHLFESKQISFSQLFGKQRTRNQLIATFLAVLELVRTRFARVRQQKQFDEIVIEKIDEDRYGKLFSQQEIPENVEADQTQSQLPEDENPEGEKIDP